jgi:hypothetical protein
MDDIKCDVPLYDGKKQVLTRYLPTVVSRSSQESSFFICATALAVLVHTSMIGL